MHRSFKIFVERGLSLFPVRMFCPVMVLASASLVVVNGCAKELSPQLSYTQGQLVQVLEKQESGQSVESESEYIDDLPEMTAQDYEDLGDRFVAQGKPELAVIKFSKALEKDPSDVGIQYKLGNLFLARGLAQEAYDRFQTILEADPMFALAYEGMGKARLQLGDDQDAERQFRRALSFDPSLWKSHVYLGIIADRRHLHLTAIDAYHAALALHPNDPAIMNNLGMAQYLYGHYQEAAKIFSQALRLNPQSEKIANNLGLALSKLGRYAEAFNAFERGTDSARAYNNVGILMLEAGRPRQALACFKEAIEQQSTFYEKANKNLALAQKQISPPASRLVSAKTKRFHCFRGQG